MLSKFGVGVY